jgi:hypothetical protein
VARGEERLITQFSSETSVSLDRALQSSGDTHFVAISGSP